MDSSGRRKDDVGREFFNPWRRRRSVFIELVEGAREGGSGGGKRVRGTEVRLQGRLGGSGGARGDGSVVAVLGWLGGIPPSSLDARGGTRQREEAGWAGWASPCATGKGFPFFYFLFCSSDICFAHLFKIPRHFYKCPNFLYGLTIY